MREVQDEVKRLYGAGYSIRRIQMMCGVSRRQAAKIVGVLRPSTRKPRPVCLEWDRPVVEPRHRWGRCRFHVRLYWAERKRR